MYISCGHVQRPTWSATITIPALDSLFYRNCLADTILIIQGVRCLRGPGKGDKMTLITESRCFVPLRRGLRCGSCPAVSELNLRALVVVFLGRVFLPIMSEQDVKNGETSADQTDTTLGISKNRLGDAIPD
jgi:hypothetical protein